MKARVTRKQAVMFTAMVGPLVLSNILLPSRTSMLPRDRELLFVALTVAIAMLGSRAAALIAGLMGALCYDFFFTTPYQSLSQATPTDLVTEALMVVLSVTIAHLAFRIRRLGATAASETGYLQRIHGTARMAQSSAGPDAVLKFVQQELTELLSLQDCRFTTDTGPGQPAQLAEDGSVLVDGKQFDVEALGMPQQEISLPIFSGAKYWGHFVLTPTVGATAPLQARLTALNLADQAALALGRPQTNRPT